MQEPDSARLHLGQGKVIFQVFGKPFSESRDAWERCVVAVGGCGVCDGQLGTWGQAPACLLPVLDPLVPVGPRQSRSLSQPRAVAAGLLTGQCCRAVPLCPWGGAGKGLVPSVSRCRST